MVFFTENLERFLQGEPLRNVVEKQLGLLTQDQGRCGKSTLDPGMDP